MLSFRSFFLGGGEVFVSQEHWGSIPCSRYRKTFGLSYHSMAGREVKYQWPGCQLPWKIGAGAGLSLISTKRCDSKPLSMQSLHPTKPQSEGERSSMTVVYLQEEIPSCPLHAQEKLLHLFIAVCNPESVLPDVLAIHTIEVIPKSMILTL